MEAFDRAFQLFWTYAGPFLLAWWCLEWARVRPRTGRTVALAAFSGAAALYGLVRLGWTLLETGR